MQPRQVAFVAIALFLVVVTSVQAQTQIPTVLHLQGVLSDESGTPLGEAEVALRFELFDAGTGGTALWSQSFGNVAVVQGFYEIALGDPGVAQSSPLAELPFDELYYLQISMRRAGEIDYQVIGDRRPLGTTPYSFRSMSSEQADTSADTPVIEVSTGLQLDITGNEYTLSVAPGGISPELIEPAPDTDRTYALLSGENGVAWGVIAGGGGDGSGVQEILTQQAGGLSSAETSPGVVSLSIAEQGVDASKLAVGAVTTTSIADQAVDAGQLAPGAVGAAALRDGSISAEKFAPGAVDRQALATDAVDGTVLADGAVDSDALANGAVGSDALADGTAVRSLTVRQPGGDTTLTDDVALVAGQNIVLSQTDNAVTISSEGGGVPNVNGITGAVEISGAGGATVTRDGNNIIVSASGGGGEGGIEGIQSGPASPIEISDPNGPTVTVDIAEGSITNSYLAANAVGTTEIADGSVSGADLAGDAVTSIKVEDGSLTGVDIADGSVTGTDIEDGSLTGEDIAAGSLNGSDISAATIDGTHIVDESLTGSDLLDGSVSSADITDESITGTDILDGSIGSVDLAEDAVGSSQVADESLTGDDILDGSLTAADFDISAFGDITNVITDEGSGLIGGTDAGEVSLAIAEEGVTSTRLALGAVTSDKIAPAAVTTAALQADAVTGAQILDETITGADIADGSIELADLGDSIGDITEITTEEGSGLTGGVAQGAADLAIAELGVTGTHLADDAVTSDKIADGDILSADLGEASVTSVAIANGAVQTDHIAPNAITTGKIANGAVTVADLAANAVTTAKIAPAAVTESSLANDSVTSGKIADGSVTEADLASDAVTGANIADESITGDDIADGSISASDISFPVGDITGVLTQEGSGLVGGTPDGDADLAIANLGVTTARLDDDAVVSSKIADGSVQYEDIAADAIDDTKILDGSIYESDIYPDELGSDALWEQIDLGQGTTTGFLWTYQYLNDPMVPFDGQSETSYFGSSGNFEAGLLLLYDRDPSVGGRIVELSSSGDGNDGLILVYQEGNEDATCGMIGETGEVFGSNIVVSRSSGSSANETIQYATLTGPESAIYVRGKSKLVDGRATITFPDHFRDQVNPETITVTLTPRSLQSLGLAVAETFDDRLEVGELQSGRGSYEFDYVIYGVRSGEENFRVVRPGTTIAGQERATVAPRSVNRGSRR